MATQKKKTTTTKTRKPRAKKVAAPVTLPEVVATVPIEPVVPQAPEIVEPQYTSDEYAPPTPVAKKHNWVPAMWAVAIVAMLIVLYMVK